MKKKITCLICVFAYDFMQHFLNICGWTVYKFVCYPTSWLVGILLVSRSGLVEENAVEVFHHYGVHLSSSLLMQIFSWLAGLCYYVVKPTENLPLGSPRRRWEANIRK